MANNWELKLKKKKSFARWACFLVCKECRLTTYSIMSHYSATAPKIKWVATSSICKSSKSILTSPLNFWGWLTQVSEWWNAITVFLEIKKKMSCMLPFFFFNLQQHLKFDGFWWTVHNDKQFMINSSVLYFMSTYCLKGKVCSFFF